MANNENDKNELPFDNIAKSIQNQLRLQIEKNAMILDISTFPFLDQILLNENKEKPIKIYIPDTIKKLGIPYKEKNYTNYLWKLLHEFSTQPINPNMINKILEKNFMEKYNIEFITTDMVDMKTYNYCYDKFTSDRFIVEFSPKFNILGDYIGKLLAGLKKLDLTVLMMNTRLLTKIHWTIPILNMLKSFNQQKVNFFEKYIPYVEPTKVFRWILGGALMISPEYTDLGWVLWILDP